MWLPESQWNGLLIIHIITSSGIFILLLRTKKDDMMVFWAFVAVVLCHDGNPSQGGHTVWEKYWWEEMDEKGILKAVAFEWGAGEDRYGGGVGASIWNLYSTPHNWWASRPTNLQILNLNGKLSPICFLEYFLLLASSLNFAAGQKKHKDAISGQKTFHQFYH